MLDTEQAVEEIARRIRAWRAEASLTLQQLAQRSGVAASTIHKVESLHMVPTIAVLLKITRGLNRRPSDLLADDSWSTEIAVRSTVDPTAGPVRQLSCELRDPQLAVWRIELAAGQGIPRQTLSHDGEIAVHCEAGELLATVAGKAYRLKAGDTIQFKSKLEVQWQSDGEDPARFLVIGTDSPELGRLIRANAACAGARLDAHDGVPSSSREGPSRPSTPAPA